MEKLILTTDEKIELNLKIQDELIYGKPSEDELLAIANILGLEVENE